LGRAEREVRRALSAPLATVGLTLDEFFLLAACDAPNLPGQTELTTSAALSAAQTSTLLDRLRQRTWLTAQRDSADRRRQVWELTEEGRLKVKQGWLALAPLLDDLRQRLAPAAWESLGRALSELATPASAERRRCA
jgi:DNA-binding MarR family transcriptional regulator